MGECPKWVSGRRRKSQRITSWIIEVAGSEFLTSDMRAVTAFLVPLHRHEAVTAEPWK